MPLSKLPLFAVTVWSTGDVLFHSTVSPTLIVIFAGPNDVALIETFTCAASPTRGTKANASTRNKNAPIPIRERVATLRRRAEQAGRDPQSISVSIWGAKPDRTALTELEQAGVERAIFTVPAADRDTVLGRLDSYLALRVTERGK